MDDWQLTRFHQHNQNITQSTLPGNTGASFPEGAELLALGEPAGLKGLIIQLRRLFRLPLVTGRLDAPYPFFAFGGREAHQAVAIALSHLPPVEAHRGPTDR